MSAPSNPGAPAARPRPASVTISGYLLILVALLFAIVAIAGLSTIGTTSDVIKEAYAGTSMEGTESFVIGAGIAGAVVQFLFAAGYVVLALLNNQGRNASRIVTWVISGLGICCTGLNVAGTTAGSVSGGGGTGDVPDADELSRRLDAALPSWLSPLQTTSSVIALIALLAVVILLALPASNEFFRKPAVGWEPPVPGSAYPGYPQATGGDPGYPQATGGDPGYPQAGNPGYPPSNPGYPPSNPGYPPSNPPNNPPYPPTNPPNPPAS